MVLDYLFSSTRKLQFYVELADKTLKKTHFTPKIHKNTDLILIKMNVSIVSEQSSIIVKFVLKLFHIYITSVYFLYLCNVLTSIAIPEANSSQQGAVE